jgi:hypothetical protein
LLFRCAAHGLHSPHFRSAPEFRIGRHKTMPGSKQSSAQWWSQARRHGAPWVRSGSPRLSSHCVFRRRQLKNYRITMAPLTPWPETASELYRPRYRRLSAKLVPNFANRGCYMVSVKDSYGRILGFLDRSRYFSFQAAPQLYSRG